MSESRTVPRLRVRPGVRTWSPLPGFWISARAFALKHYEVSERELPSSDNLLPTGERGRLAA